MDRWFSTFWGLLCFISIKWSCFLGTNFSCFFEMSFLGVVLNDEASNIILLETPTKYSDTGCWFVQSWSNAHILKENCLLLWTSHAEVSLAWVVGCHFASGPTNLTIFDGSQCFWYSVAVARSDDFVHMWILMFVTLRSENRLQLISFSKIWCLAELQFEMILWIVGFQLLEDFFESMKRSSFLDTKFWCFFEMSFLGVVLINEVSITIRVSWV